MKNLFSQILDVNDYIINSEFDKLASFSVNDNIPNTDEDITTDNDYAIILYHPQNGELRKFACYTPQLTELNMQCLAHKMDVLPKELVKIAATNLTCAASRFHIPIPEKLAEYKSRQFVPRVLDTRNINELKLVEKTASFEQPDNEVYALGDKYPLSNAQLIKKASNWFDKYYAKLDIDEINEFTGNILKQAEVFNVNMEKTAAYKFATLKQSEFNPEFYYHVQVRKSFLPEDSDELKSNYNELVQRADELGTIKTAYLLEYIDKEAGLTDLYGSKIVDPLQSTCASKDANGIDIDDVYITLDQLRKLKNDDLTVIVGSDAIKDLKGEDGLAVLASLPKPVRGEVLSLIEGK